MLPFCLWLVVVIGSSRVQGWGGLPGLEHNPYRVPLLRSFPMARRSGPVLTSHASALHPPLPHTPSDEDIAIHQALVSRSHVVHESLPPSSPPSSQQQDQQHQHSSDLKPHESQLPVEMHLSHVRLPVPREDSLAQGVISSNNNNGNSQQPRTNSGGSSSNNPAFETHHVHFRKRSAHEDEEDPDVDGMVHPPPPNGGQGGLTNSTGLSEMEIAVIVVCAALGLLACVIGLIFLARYYWKKLHDDSLGYQGVMQRDSSESSIGTTRVDVKEANAKFEEMDASSPTNKTPDVLIITHQSSDNSTEKVPLLPCANGTAITERSDPSGVGDSLQEESVKKAKDAQQSQGKEAMDIQSSSAALEESSVPILLYSRLGLSQSDCSISSNTSVNPTYKYGNQTEYMGGYYGYPCDETFSDHVHPPHVHTTHAVLPPTVCVTTPSLSDANMIAEAIASEYSKEIGPEEDDDRDGEGDAVDDVFDNMPLNNEPASPRFAEAEDVEDEGANHNATDNSASSVFDVDTDPSKHSANNSMVGLQEDLLDPCRLTEGNRAVGLPESFSLENGDGAAVDRIPGDISDVIGGRPEDSGWGDTDKGQFRGSLPVIHLNVSPDASVTTRSGHAASMPSSSSTSYPVSEEVTPTDTEGKPLLSSSNQGESSVPSAFVNIVSMDGRSAIKDSQKTSLQS